jgi:quercetin dioxygenase-like cupin family protein
MSPRAALYRWEDLPLDKITEMITRKAIAGAAQSMAQSYLKKGALVPRHAHAREQMIYVLQGALRLLVDLEETTVREGEVLVVPASVPHQIEAIDDTFLLTVTCL